MAFSELSTEAGVVIDNIRGMGLAGLRYKGATVLRPHGAQFIFPLPKLATPTVFWRPPCENLPAPAGF